MTIQEAIAQAVALGETDPAVIARNVRTRFGAEWLSEQLLELADDLLADIARQELGRDRRRLELAIRPGDPLTSAEVKIAKTWVPGVGWKRVGDLTETDLLARADWYEGIADTAMIRADWCRTVAHMMRGEGASVLAELRQELPPLRAPELAA